MISNTTWGIKLTREGCAWSPGDVEANVRSDVQALKSSPYVRNGITVIGYVLDVASGQLSEVRYVERFFFFVPTHFYDILGINVLRDKDVRGVVLYQNVTDTQ
jgi:hypothetical protein